MSPRTSQSEAVNTDLLALQKKEQAIAELYAKLREVDAKLVGSDGKCELLPRNLNPFLQRLLADLSAGHSVTILQNHSQLTTIEAGKLLGLSRQFLVELLKKGEMPFHMVGTHRRVYARDVLTYKAKRDASRRKILNDLARAEYAEGLYDPAPDEFNSGR